MTSKQPASYGLTLTETKTYLKVEHNLEDTLLNGLISASYQHVCNHCNRDLVETVCTTSFYSGSTEFIATQDVTDLSTGSLVRRYDGNWIVFDDYYTGNVSYRTAVSSSMPEPAKIAQLMLVSQFFENRSTIVVGASVSPLQIAVDALLQPYVLVNPC